MATKSNSPQATLDTLILALGMAEAAENGHTIDMHRAGLIAADIRRAIRQFDNVPHGIRLIARERFDRVR